MSKNQPPTNDQVPDDHDQTPDTDPQWMRDMQGWEESPDWLRKLAQQDEQSFDVSDAEQPPLSDQAPEEPTAPEDLADREGTPGSAPPAPPDMPGPPEPSGQADQPEAVPGPELSESTDIEAELPPEPVTGPRTTKPLREETLPEQLREVPLAPSPEEPGAAAADEELDGWLQGAGEPAGEPQGPVVDEPELPAWVHEMATVAPVTPDQASDETDFSDWLSDDQDDTLPEGALLGLAAGAALGPDEMPDWVDELRAEEPEQEDLPVETSGPLAGLRGLLSPEPLMGLVPKSKYAPMPPVSEEHLAAAMALRRLLAAPSKRGADASAALGRKVMQDLGRWFVWAILVIAVCVAVFVPELHTLIQPIESLESKSFYNAVTGLPQTSNVLLVVDYDASRDGELTPQMRAVLWHLLQRRLGVVTVSHTPQGAAIVEDLFQSESLRLQGETYVPGEHYLNLGYLPAHPASMQAFMANPLGGVVLWGTAELDPSQTTLGQRVTRFEDFSLVVLVSGNQDHVRWWIEQVGNRPIELVAGASASIGPYILPYYSVAGDGQLGGMLVGLAGAAEYERLVGAGTYARENFVLQASAQILLVVIVLVSGISVMIGRAKS